MPESKRAAGKPISDVARPGKTPPAGTSKPVIITNRPVLKDPMVIENNKSPDDNSTSSKSSTDVKLQPTTAPLLEPDASKTEDAPATETVVHHEKILAKSSTAPTVEEAKSETEPDTAGQSAEKEVPKPDETADSENSDIPSPQQTDKAAIDNERAKQAEHEAAIQKLVESKQYFLPINSVEKRRTKRFVALGILVSLLLAITWVDVALDAGLIKLHGVQPVTHFFST